MNSRGQVTLDYCWVPCKEKIININVMVAVVAMLVVHMVMVAMFTVRMIVAVVM